MRFGFDEDQLAVRDTVAALLDKQFPLAALRQAWQAGNGAGLRGLWGQLAHLGVQGLLAPEDLGGPGLDEVTMALVLAETGRVALPLPVMETAAVGVPLIAAAGDPTGVLPQLMDGSLVLTATSGCSGLAPAAGMADLFLVQTADGCVLYGRRDVEVEPVPSVDRTRDLARIHPRGTPGRAGTLIGAASYRHRAAVGSAAQLIGLGRELIRTAVEYVKERRQFGVPVGSFQAVKHHLADATLQVELAAPAVWAAAQVLSQDRPDSDRAASMAKAMASDAATGAARIALQCHGAMGYTDEYHLHLWMKRVWCLAAAHGSADWHRDRVGRELGI